MKPDKLQLRFVEEKDMSSVVEIERLATLPWALGEKGLLEIIKRRRDDLKGTFDTRMMVIEIPKSQSGNPDSTLSKSLR